VVPVKRTNHDGGMPTQKGGGGSEKKQKGGELNWRYKGDRNPCGADKAGQGGGQSQKRTGYKKEEKKKRKGGRRRGKTEDGERVGVCGSYVSKRGAV